MSISRNLDLKSLRSFVALAEELHFAKAAQRVSTTQSVVSRQLQRLEDEVGGALLERTTREVRLTDAGAALLVDARQLLEHAERVEARARAATAGWAGLLRIGVTPASGSSSASRCVKAFRAQRPDVGIELVEAGSIDLEAALAEGTIDCAFLHPSGGNCALTAIPVAQDPLGALMMANDTLAGETSIEPGHLNDRDILFYQRHRAAALHDRFIALLDASGSRPRSIMPCTTFGHAIAATAASLGIAFLPQSMANMLPEGTILQQFADGALVLETVLAFNTRRLDDPLTAGLRAIAASQ